MTELSHSPSGPADALPETRGQRPTSQPGEAVVTVTPPVNSAGTSAVTPVISVVIPCFNCAHTLAAQLEALATQAQAPPFEVILVDNRSTDRLRQVVEQWRNRLPMLRLVYAGATQGASYARNVGIGAARADRLMFCDADDVVSTWWLNHGQQSFEVGQIWSGACIPVAEHAFPASAPEVRTLIGDRSLWEGLVDDQAGAFPVLMGGNFGITRDALDVLIGFDQSLPTAGEDNDLAFRARRHGFRIPISPSTRVAYRQRDEPRAHLRSVFREGVAHALIATRYDAWDESPNPPWLTGIVRCIAAGALMCVSRSRRDWAALAERAYSATGIAYGALRYRRAHLLPPPQIGHGTTEQAR